MESGEIDPHRILLNDTLERSLKIAALETSNQERIFVDRRPF